MNAAKRASGPRVGEALRAAAFDASPWPALLLDGEGDLITVNAAAEALFGQALSWIMRRRLDELLPQGDLLTALVERTRGADAPARERLVRLHLPDQPPLEAEAITAPLPDGTVLLTLMPKPGGLTTERAAETLKSAAGLGRTLAHEIKNPLAGIRGAAQLLQAEAGADDAALAQLIIDETDRIRRLVDRVEAFSDERPSQLGSVNIHRVLDRVRALIAAGMGDGIVLREAFDPSLPHALGDEDQLIQVFLNLMKNAAEAVRLRDDGRGEIVLATSYRHTGRKRGREARSTPLEVRIQDNGPGVPDGLREHLFEPFITTKPQGTGLGLTLVAKLVASHGGLIEFDSEPGRTVFRVLLPVDPPPSRKTP